MNVNFRGYFRNTRHVLKYAQKYNISVFYAELSDSMFLLTIVIPPCLPDYTA